MTTEVPASSEGASWVETVLSHLPDVDWVPDSLRPGAWSLWVLPKFQVLVCPSYTPLGWHLIMYGLPGAPSKIFQDLEEAKQAGRYLASLVYINRLQKLVNLND